jgi:hypothetical protein
VFLYGDGGRQFVRDGVAFIFQTEAISLSAGRGS